MKSVKDLEILKGRVIYSDLYKFYVTDANNQENTRVHFNLSRHGLIHLLDAYKISKTPEQLKETFKHTNLMLHGDSNYNNRDKCLETFAKNYGSVHDAFEHIREVSKETKRDRYSNEKFTNREKAKSTLFSKTNYEYGHQSEESKQKAVDTYYKKTGYLNPSFNPEIKSKISKIYNSKSDEEKASICKKKSDYWKHMQPESLMKRLESLSNASKIAQKKYRELSDEEKQKYVEMGKELQKNYYSSLSDEEKQVLIKKRFQTMHDNNTLKSSKYEDTVYEMLCKKYGDVKRQYKEERYPFYCDFYVPSEDLFIELNAHWTHGGKKFDNKDSGCVKQLNEWKEKAKNSEFYGNAIHTWTVRDVEKNIMAIKNNLNYSVIYRCDLKEE